MVQGRIHEGAPFYQNEEGQWFVPLAEISAAAGLGAPVLEDGFIDWEGFWMDSTNPDFFMNGDTLYAASYLLEDAGLTVKTSCVEGVNVIAIGCSGGMDVSWAASPYVAHALGGIDGRRYTNSQEAFSESYRKNYTLYEADLTLSAEGVPLLIHDLAQYEVHVQNGDETVQVDLPPTVEQFTSRKILGQYTGLTFEDLARLMVQFPSVTIITDTGGTDEQSVKEMFRAILDVAQAVDPAILDRIIPQVYNNDMIGWLNELYPWRSMVYTFYQLPQGMTQEEAFFYGYSQGLRAFAVEQGGVEPRLMALAEAMDCKAYVYTLNDWGMLVYELQTMHASGIYTDFLDPLSMEGVEEWTDETVPAD